MAKRFQFSIRWIFTLTAIVGLICAVLLTRPTPVTGGLFLLLLVVIPAVAVVGIIQGQGFFRAFCVGAGIPSSFGMIVWWSYVDQYSGSFEPLEYAGEFGGKAEATFIWATALFTGLACVGFYWFIKLPKKD